MYVHESSVLSPVPLPGTGTHMLDHDHCAVTSVMNCMANSKSVCRRISQMLTSLPANHLEDILHLFPRLKRCME